MPGLIRETFPVGPLGCNCTIVGDPLTKNAIVIDPGGDHMLILARLEELGLRSSVSSTPMRIWIIFSPREK